MIDISEQSLKLDCPGCKKSVSVTIKQVAEEALLKCSCGQEIQLRDSNGTSKNAIRDINMSFRDLEKAFKKFGK
jgi:transcription elongation factor Elf1